MSTMNSSSTYAPHDILATYTEREVKLELDESELELGILNSDNEDYNREKITQTEFGHLSAIGSLSRVQYGKWADQPACLICFRIQLLGTTSSIWRFDGADVFIEFTARLKGKAKKTEPKDDPNILNYGPKFLRSQPTPEHRGWHLLAQLSAQANQGPVSIGPMMEGGKSGEYTRQHASTIQSSDSGDSKHNKPNRLRISYKQDAKQESRSAHELLIACIVAYAGPFQCTVKVKANLAFPQNLIFGAAAWGKDDPVLLEPGITLLPLGKETLIPDDFETMSDDQWRQLVTSDLSYQEAIQSIGSAT